jgi:hypothetical protein
MRRLELRRLHPDDRSVWDDGAAFARTVTLVGWNMAMDIFVYRGPAPHAGLGGFVQSHAGKKAGGRLWGLILPEVL